LPLLTLGWAKALIFAVGYTLINNFFDIAIAPRYLGKGLDLSTIVTFLAVVFWAWILGPNWCFSGPAPDGYGENFAAGALSRNPTAGSTDGVWFS
jgi:hypothetical protein